MLLEEFLSVECEVDLSAEISAGEGSVLAAMVDLEAIGSGSVVNDKTYEQWERQLTSRQKSVLDNPIDVSIRIVGPAGSGKTLALCMRAVQIARDPSVASQGKKVLIATHSWAMANRIDGVLSVLNGGMTPPEITTYPLLSLLQEHVGYIGQQRTDVIGDDSSEGRRKSLEIIDSILASPDKLPKDGVSPSISEALRTTEGGRGRVDLTINIYEEITGVLTASGVSPDDLDSIEKYMTDRREDWLPPFSSRADRGFVISVYERFIQALIDRSAITTDQFILDSLRVLETFTWRMRRETEGYDFVLVDELQLFDPQERSALELFARSKRGVPFVTAEDPSQGVFSALNVRQRASSKEPIYFDRTHRFNKGIFGLISFIYQQFPLNTPLFDIERHDEDISTKPVLYVCRADMSVVRKAAELAESAFKASTPSGRICLLTLGGLDDELVQELERRRLSVTRLEGFDDVERLAYRKRSLVVAPWQFIGGTQFSHVVVVAAGLSEPSSQFAKRMELTSVYLSCSRASDSLNVICSGYIPHVLREAKEANLLLSNDFQL